MYTNDREAYRKAFFEAWAKYKKQLAIEPVEVQMVDIILLHPEYFSLLDKPSSFTQQEFPIEENPFLHMSLHMAIREQIRMDKPQGIAQIYQELLGKYEQPHEAEHHMIACLAAILWEAQQSGNIPSEEEYLKKLRE